MARGQWRADYLALWRREFASAYWYSGWVLSFFAQTAVCAVFRVWWLVASGLACTAAVVAILVSKIVTTTIGSVPLQASAASLARPLSL